MSNDDARRLALALSACLGDHCRHRSVCECGHLQPGFLERAAPDATRYWTGSAAHDHRRLSPTRFRATCCSEMTACAARRTRFRMFSKKNPGGKARCLDLAM